MKRAFEMLCADPQRAGVQQHQDLPGLHRFHLRHARKRGVAPKQPRHFIVFTHDAKTLTILRVLHDSMDLPQHVADNEGEA